jgi:sodium-dependent dicarboxylate transporter 2/3/5
VHEQIAHGILTIVGDSKPRILLGFIFSTGLISMWISNTATALMMLPMAMAIIHALPVAHQKSKFSLYLVLSIAYASSIGGMATLVGTPTNTQMAAILEQNYGITIGFFEWMKIALPISLLMLFITYVYFYFSLGKERLDLHDFKIVKKPWSTEQIRVILVFGGVVFLWIFKDLINDLTPVKYDDENVAILGAVLLFIIPANKTKKPLLNWSDTEKLPWGILLLFGGGLALAKMLEVNGIVALLSDVLASFDNESIFVIIVAMVAITIFASELLSNLALVVICIPIVAAFAKLAGFDILQLCIPLTLAASCAFMLPMGTPPNAIVFSSGFVSMGQMARAGFILNIIGIILISFFGIFFL